MRLLFNSQPLPRSGQLQTPTGQVSKANFGRIILHCTATICHPVRQEELRRISSPGHCDGSLENAGNCITELRPDFLRGIRLGGNEAAVHVGEVVPGSQVGRENLRAV